MANSGGVNGQFWRSQQPIPEESMANSGGINGQFWRNQEPEAEDRLGVGVWGAKPPNGRGPLIFYLYIHAHLNCYPTPRCVCYEYPDFGLLLLQNWSLTPPELAVDSSRIGC